MALDLKKEVNFKELFSKKPKTQPASKQHINLYKPEIFEAKKRLAIKAGIIGGIILVILLITTVIIPLHQINQSKAQLASVQAQEHQLEEQLTDFDTIKEEFAQYELGAGLENKATVVKVLNLTDVAIRPVAEVKNVSFNDNSLHVVMYDADLDQLSSIGEHLQEFEGVEHVSIESTQKENDEGVSSTESTMTIAIAPEKSDKQEAKN